MNDEPPFYGDQIQGDRNYQEDSFSIKVFGNETLLLLCDGMGGHVAGKQASSLAVEEFVQGFSQHIDSPSYKRLETGLTMANSAIQQKVSQSAELKGMGTTLVAVHLSGDTIYWVSVGDSPLWLVRENKIQRLNADHSLAGVFKKLVEQGQMTAQDAANDPKRHALLSSVSGDEIKHVDLRESAFELLKGDCLLLASDGLETLSDEDIIRLVAGNDKPKKTVALLLDAVTTYQKPQQDNATVMVYRHGMPSGKTSKFSFFTSSVSMLLSMFLVAVLLILGAWQW
ncbi:PP2C family protein-serine/threonine phosphatase [Paraglaciecola arctica]|uniref:Protein phosphatase n=1 Tax=Paraglaciecola arctica BSs20135 TaxID=493475 RepID=K6YDJ3_9ALTE|nr:protein phosphatase 2C domain-containing protein [Paraglaciecola arctica]GAC22026.1 protein phosphatase [Paraglaciecola arctica BSs20135]